MRVIVAWIVGLGLIAIGLTMLAVPDAWYAFVPGVPETGPLNPHFVRDIGAAYLVAGATLVWFAIDRAARPAALAGAHWSTCGTPRLDANMPISCSLICRRSFYRPYLRSGLSGRQGPSLI